ncbi:MAG: D-glycero-beta-D-manno-heptose 1-phosphate adenylyltransferase [Bacteroidia bacterium]
MFYKNKIVTLDVLATRRKTWADAGEKVVFTNGCFDILHRGHVDYLNKAKDLGTKLIAAVNSDKSISTIKSPSRPIQDEISRSEIMASLGCVDAVIIFDDDTPYDLIKTLVPDILVKGADYKPEDIVGYDIVTGNGGKVLTIDFLPGYSTSLIEKKIKES